MRVDSCDEVKYIEHIQAHVTLGASKRGDVQIWLVSPKGTRSNLIAKRPKDYSRAGFNDWPFLTVNYKTIFEYIDIMIISLDWTENYIFLCNRFICGKNLPLEHGHLKSSIMEGLLLN